MTDCSQIFGEAFERGRTSYRLDRGLIARAHGLTREPDYLSLQRLEVWICLWGNRFWWRASPLVPRKCAVPERVCGKAI